MLENIQVAYNWDERNLKALECEDSQLLGYYYSDEEIGLDFVRLDEPPKIGERMLFRIHNELFYCDQIELESFKESKFDYWPEKSRMLKRSPSKLTITIKGRVVSRC